METQLKLSLLLLIVISFVLPLFVHATDVKYCDKKGNYAVKIKDVEISPNPVVSGQPATFNLSASTGDLISGGKVVIDVNFFAIHVHTETHDLCEEVSCPIAPSSFVLSHSQTLPVYTPPVNCLALPPRSSNTTSPQAERSSAGAYRLASCFLQTLLLMCLFIQTC